MFVFNWMTSTPVCINAQDALLKAEELMNTHQVNQILVQDAGKLVGIFPIGTYVMPRLPWSTCRAFRAKRLRI